MFSFSSAVTQSIRRMPRDGKRELRLACRSAVNSDDDQRARIENCGQCRQPGLVAVLRAIVSKYRIGQVTFEQFSRPSFPVPKKCPELLEFFTIKVAPQQLRRRRRRSGTRI